MRNISAPIGDGFRVKAKIDYRFIELPGYGVLKVSKNVYRTPYGWNVIWKSMFCSFTDSVYGGCINALESANAFRNKFHPGRTSRIQVYAGVSVVHIQKPNGSYAVYAEARSPAKISAKRIYIGILGRTDFPERFDKALIKANELRDQMVVNHLLRNQEHFVA